MLISTSVKSQSIKIEQEFFAQKEKLMSIFKSKTIQIKNRVIQKFLYVAEKIKNHINENPKYKKLTFRYEKDFVCFIIDLITQPSTRELRLFEYILNKDAENISRVFRLPCNPFTLMCKAQGEKCEVYEYVKNQSNYPLFAKKIWEWIYNDEVINPEVKIAPEEQKYFLAYSHCFDKTGRVKIMCLSPNFKLDFEAILTLLPNLEYSFKILQGADFVEPIFSQYFEKYTGKKAIKVNFNTFFTESFKKPRVNQIVYMG